MTLSQYWIASIFAVTVSSIALAQEDTLPVHQIGDAATRSSIPLHNVSGLRELSDGRVLVDDNVDHRVVLFDRALSALTSVMEGNDGKLSGWQAPGTLIGYHGDSTLILLGTDVTLQLIGPTGALGRPIAFPIPGDAAKILPTDGQPVIDRDGRLVYRGSLPLTGAMNRDRPDSAPLVRVTFSTRRADTLTYVKVRGEVISRAPAGTTPPVLVRMNPLAPIDDWVVFDDGTVAIVRAADYHVDWISPDGTKKSTPPVTTRKVPFARANLIAALSRIQDSLQTNPSYRIEFTSDSLLTVIPPFRGNTAKADRDGNIWVLRFHPEAPGAGLAYDVVNHAGVLIDRVQLPMGSTLAGFGNGVVYLGMNDAGAVHLVRVPFRVGGR